MRRPSGRIGGVVLVAAAVVGVAAYLRVGGPGGTAPVAPVPTQAQPHPQTQIETGAQTNAVAWLDAQPRSSDPPEALPVGLWSGAARPAQQPPSHALRLEIVGERGRQNVVLHDADGRVHELTGFTQPQHVYDAAASADGALAFVWHMAYSPRQVSVYDVRTRELRHRFAPGSGGDLRWAASDPVLLLETGGMGMGGAMVRAFAPDGTTLVRTGIGSYAFSPDDRWVLSLSWLNGRGRVEVFRIATGERAFGALLPASVTFFMVEPQWDGDRGPVLRIVIDREHEVVEAFELERLVPILHRVPEGE